MAMVTACRFVVLAFWHQRQNDSMTERQGGKMDQGKPKDDGKVNWRIRQLAWRRVVRIDKGWGRPRTRLNANRRRGTMVSQITASGAFRRWYFATAPDLVLLPLPSRGWLNS